MKTYHFSENSPIKSLYVEFTSMTSYVHSIRRNDKRIEPYEPSMFVYSYFTFNTLFNIDWEGTKSNGYVKIIWPDRSTQNTSERERIKMYIEYLFNGNIMPLERMTEIFRSSVLYLVKAYGMEKKDCEINKDKKLWIDNQLEHFAYSSVSGGDRETVFTYTRVSSFRTMLKKILDGRALVSKENLYELADLIYDVRCNMFHGAKSPDCYSYNCQSERFVIYASILCGINQMLFAILNKATNVKVD